MASDVAPVGGMEGVAYELASRLLSRGWELTVIARSCALPVTPAMRFRRILAPSRPVSVALAMSFVHGSLELARVREGIVQTNNAIVANRVDVVHVHFCQRAYRALGGPSRSRRDTLAYRLNSWLATWIDLASEAWCYRPGRARALSCVSSGLQEEVGRCYPGVEDRTVVVPNGVDRARFARDAALGAQTHRELGLGDDRRVAIFIGGDWHRKGLGVAIDAVARAPGWELLVVGEGDVESFAGRARAGGAGDRVHFLGRRPDPRPYLWAADALVFPSSYEAFSIVTLEAAAAGLALLVPRINGAQELVGDGVNGWLVRVDADDIAGRLRQLTADPELLARMGAAAVRSSEPYDWETVVDAFEGLYATLSRR